MGVRLTAAAVVLAMGCGFDPGGSSGQSDSPSDPLGPDAGAVVPTAVTISGTVTDFATGQPIAAAFSIEVLGLPGTPAVDISGSEFSITGVPRQSLVSLRVTAEGFRPTVGEPVEIAADDVVGLEPLVVSDAYAQSLASEFGVDANGSLLVTRVADGDGSPMPGLPKAIFEVEGALTANGAFLLAADRSPDSGLVETSASGYVVFQDMPAAQVSLRAKENSGYTVIAGPVMLGAGEVAITSARANVGELVLPENISLAGDLLTIFQTRECVTCHTRDGPGKDQGGLSLDGGTLHIFNELTVDPSPRTGKPRVDLMTPEGSLLVTRPSVEFPPDVHPYSTFNGFLDQDYLAILSWIYAGPANN